jgi:hypothetical protein
MVVDAALLVGGVLQYLSLGIWYFSYREMKPSSESRLAVWQQQADRHQLQLLICGARKSFGGAGPRAQFGRLDKRVRIAWEETRMCGSKVGY